MISLLISKLLDFLSNKYEQILLIGDFNIEKNVIILWITFVIGNSVVDLSLAYSDSEKNSNKNTN